MASQDLGRRGSGSVPPPAPPAPAANTNTNTLKRAKSGALLSAVQPQRPPTAAGAAAPAAAGAGRTAKGRNRVSDHVRAVVTAAAGRTDGDPVIGPPPVVTATGMGPGTGTGDDVRRAQQQVTTGAGYVGSPRGVKAEPVNEQQQQQQLAQYQQQQQRAAAAAAAAATAAAAAGQGAGVLPPHLITCRLMQAFEPVYPDAKWVALVWGWLTVA